MIPVLLDVATKNIGQRLHRNVLFLQYIYFFVEIIYKGFSYRLLAVITRSSDVQHYSLRKGLLNTEVFYQLPPFKGNSLLCFPQKIHSGSLCQKVI